MCHVHLEQIGNRQSAITRGVTGRVRDLLRFTGSLYDVSLADAVSNFETPIIENEVTFSVR